MNNQICQKTAYFRIVQTIAYWLDQLRAMGFREFCLEA